MAIGPPKPKYDKNDYTPAELKLVEAKLKEIDAQLVRIKTANTKEEKQAIARSLAESQKDAINKDQTGDVAGVVFTLVGERLFNINIYNAASDNDKFNMGAGKIFYSNFKEKFKDYVFQRAAMEQFNGHMLQRYSGVLLKFCDENAKFRKDLISTMENIIKAKKGKIDGSVTLSTVIAPSVKAVELLPLLKALQADKTIGAAERDLYNITINSIEKDARQNPKPVPLRR
jgi:hypothetical protein